MRQIDLVAQAVDALTDVDDDLAHALVDEIIDPFWADYEPMPPVYDGPRDELAKLRDTINDLLDGVAE